MCMRHECSIKLQEMEVLQTQYTYFGPQPLVREADAKANIYTEVVINTYKLDSSRSFSSIDIDSSYIHRSAHLHMFLIYTSK